MLSSTPHAGLLRDVEHNLLTGEDTRSACCECIPGAPDYTAPYVAPPPVQREDREEEEGEEGEGEKEGDEVRPPWFQARACFNYLSIYKWIDKKI